MPKTKRGFIINKFGGEIMGNFNLSYLGVSHIKSQLRLGYKPVVVVSALKGVTDSLVEVLNRLKRKRKVNGIVDLFVKDIYEKHKNWACNLNNYKENKIEDIISNFISSLLKDLEVIAKFGDIKEVSDKILSYGERLSSVLFTHLLIENNINSCVFAGEELGIITNDKFGDADIIYDLSYRNVVKKIHRNLNRVPVITGFIGRTRTGQTTTLGRGGSDTTACFIGSALNADRVILWKNVRGVLSADPRIVKGARTVKRLDYEEAEESGKVIHDKSMSLIRKENIVVNVSYIKDRRIRTIITKDGHKSKGVKIISYKDNSRLLHIIGDKIKRYGALFEISQIITSYKINMSLIRNTRDSLYIVIDKNNRDFNSCEKDIIKSGYDLKARDVSMINVIGNLDWNIVEEFNNMLLKTGGDVEIGAFPYKDCVRLEAVVNPKKVKQVVKRFHRQFIK